MTENRRRLLRILIPWVSLLLLGAVTFTWGIPEWKQRRRWDNEFHAGNARYQLRAAEQQFRANDFDANGVNDFWTGDVAGLYRYGLIDRELAEADACPLRPLVPKPVPWHGYFVRVLELDESCEPPEPYAQATDAGSGKVHHRTKVGFCLFPAEPRVSGNFVYIINENGSPFRCSVDQHRTMKNWPTDQELKTFWVRDCGG